MQINLEQVKDSTNIDNLAEDGTVEEIVANHIIERMYPQQVLPAVMHWVNKLKPGGKLLLNMVDIRQVGLLAWRGETGLDSLDAMIFGQNRANRCLMDSTTVRAILERVGLKINTMSLDNCLISVEAIK